MKKKITYEYRLEMNGHQQGTSVYEKDYPKYRYHMWNRIIEKVHMNFRAIAV